MESLRDVKKRIKSVGNTSQITKAMEVVSATKMRKSQEFALRARPFAVASLEMLRNILSRTAVLPALLQTRPIKTSALLVVTSDKGLAGAFNANVLKRTELWIKEKKDLGVSIVFITVGKKAKEYLERRKYFVKKSFLGFGDFAHLEETMPVAEVILGGFLNSELDEVDAIYTNFKTTLLQETVLRRIMPVKRDQLDEVVASIIPEYGRYSELKDGNADKKRNNYSYEYIFEPSPVEILDKLVPQLLRMHIHHLILESNASEHSARMVAMKSASENAKELITDLTLVYNKARQSAITRELTEITAGREALEK